MYYDPMTPIWLQVCTHLKRDMVCGRLTAGSKMPGGRELAVQYTINPNTAARVYQELEREGLCETRRGLGTFVTSDQARLDQLRHQMAVDAIRACLQSLAGLGMGRQEAMELISKEEMDE